MKIYAALYLIIFICQPTFAQDAQSYLSRIPLLPDNPCKISDEEKNQTLEKIGVLEKEIDKQISRLRKEAKSNARNEEQEVKKNLAQQYGLSDADIQKMKKSKNMTEAEKKELMEKMMKGSKNVNIDQNKSKDMFALAQEQKTLTDKIMSQDQAFLDELKKLDESDTVAFREYNAELHPLETELSLINDGEGGTEQDALHRKAILEKIHFAREKYCANMTPPLYKILNDRLNVLKNSMPDYARLQEISSLLNKNTTGSNKDIAAPGLLQLEAVQDYLKQLNSIFKFRLY